MNSARTIPSPRDRLATILVAPFVTCSARLPVYTLLIAAFVPATTVLGFFGVQGLLMFALYLLGAVTALVSAALLKATVVRGNLARGRTVWVDPDRDGTYVYFGTIEPLETDAMIAVVDPGLIGPSPPNRVERRRVLLRLR